MSPSWDDKGGAGIVKLLEFPYETPWGEPVIRPLHVSKSGMVKTAAPLHPEVQAFMSTISPDPNSIYILVTALGSGEYYGQNINGDYFPWEALAHDFKSSVGQHLRFPYGFRTFEDAKLYAHHINKDPERSAGDVVKVVLNHEMKLVNLVIRVDRERAKKVGTLDLVERLDAGDRIDCSMGCSVPFDLCRITTDWEAYQEAYNSYNPSLHRNVVDAIKQFHENRKLQDGVGIRGLAIKKEEYSDYCKTQMGKILPDGRQVGVSNTFPRFFDISDVVVRADKVARQLVKLAGRSVSMFISPEGSLPFTPSALRAEEETGMKKVASARPFQIITKTSAFDKAADILKEVGPDDVQGKLLSYLSSKEDDIPNDILDTMAGEGVRPALSTASLLGIPLKPREFQRIMIVGSGDPGLADRLDDQGICFRDDVPGTGAEMFGMDGISELLKRVLLPVMNSRSCYPPPVTRRILTIEIRLGPGGDQPQCSDQPVLDKIASAYADYRNQLKSVFAPDSPFVKRAAIDPEIVHKMSEPWGDHMIKRAFDPALLYALAIPAATHMFSRDVLDREAKGEPVTEVESVLADHPITSALLSNFILQRAIGAVL